MALLLSANAFAQRATGSISGRVVSEEGQPIPHAKVNIVGVGGGVKKALSGRMEIVGDEAGNFIADKLDPASYSITASAPGYVVLPSEKVTGQFGAGTAKYARVGDSVTIRMLRGGVITGQVVNASGEPVIGITVEASRVRDEVGRRIAEQTNVNEMVLGRQTDDRGVYRIYGLAPGAYVVNVGAGSMGFSLKSNPFSGRAKIYYPSATRDTAVEVTVRSGEEASGIDIRYRVERGAALSGKVSGAPTGGQPAMATTVVTLAKAGTDILIGTSVILPIGENNGYSFYGLANGEYELTASRPDLSGSGSTMISEPRRITIAGRDLTGIDLALLPTASISGTIKLEKLAAPPAGQKCESGRDSFLDEIMMTAKSDGRDQQASYNQMVFGLSGALGTGSPNEKGEFTIAGLKAGRQFVEPQLPDEHWFIKSVLLTTAAANNPTAREAGKNGVTLKVGDKLTGLAVTLAEGAAGLKGKLSGDKVPSRVRIHLLPAEPEAKDDLLRFAEVIADEAGAFAFANLAPGKYLLVARAIPDSESNDKPAKPAAWDSLERAKLRKEAETANAAVELKTCQRVTDFALRWVK
ncbi:MAG: carboxypeptidase-like regulatory domain-containing protein [Acidobacteriota bacterium]|nr:carboxypeptidase-like regulatory domain-containing protein [Acidobacteriota bacterium]